MANLDIEETPDLISSNKVEGAAVFGSDGERLGQIHTLMINKRSGQVTHAVLKTGGVMGMGADYQLVPWSSLAFDDELEGYVAEIEEEEEQPARNVASYFNYAFGTEPIGHYGLDTPDEPTK
jgi:sporulation protein YlmC with PRC-barrel domain